MTSPTTTTDRPPRPDKPPTPGRSADDGWMLPAEANASGPAPVSTAPTAALSMDEIDDGWFLPDELGPAPTPAPPSTPAAEPAASETAAAEPAPALVNLNAASFEELREVPGIGRLRARRIIAERDRVGQFAAVTDLSKVKGIGPKTLDQLRPFLTV